MATLDTVESRIRASLLLGEPRSLVESSPIVLDYDGDLPERGLILSHDPNVPLGWLGLPNALTWQSWRSRGIAPGSSRLALVAVLPT